MRTNHTTASPIDFALNASGLLVNTRGQEVSLDELRETSYTAFHAACQLIASAPLPQTSTPGRGILTLVR